VRRQRPPKRSIRGRGQIGHIYCKVPRVDGQQVFTSSSLCVCTPRGRFASINACGSGPMPTARPHQAGVAQLVEQLICNHQVVGSSPITGSSIYGRFRRNPGTPFLSRCHLVAGKLPSWPCTSFGHRDHEKPLSASAMREVMHIFPCILPWNC
jgi:hypothetical protein